MQDTPAAQTFELPKPITETEAQQYYLENDTAHGFEHVLRVVALAERIARAEGADVDIVRTAALLHDIGRLEEGHTGESHAQIGARMARQILKGQPPEFVAAVVEAIAAHRYRSKSSPRSLEAKVLYDADKLDAIGAIGVARAYAMAGREGQKLWSPLSHEEESSSEGCAHTPVKEFHFKLRQIKDRLFTTTARSLAVERHAFMVEFFARLDREVRGEV